MSLGHGVSMVRSGLVFSFDAANIKCYPGSGTSAFDLAQNSTTGELVNGPTYNSSGFFSFVTNDYIRFTNSTALDTQTFSIEVWVKTNSLNQNGFWFEKGIVNTQYSLFQESVNIRCRINNGTTFVNTISVATANYMNTTDWFQVVFTFTTGSQVCYINGQVAGTGTTAATITTNTGGMSIGAYGGYSGTRGYYYNGNLSIAKVYNRVLSATEVQQNFNAMRGRYNI
mgnify:CR=1 FL=1